MAAVRFLKMLIMMRCIFLSKGVVKNQHFKTTFLGENEGVTKKTILCTLFIMLIILDDPYVLW